MDYPQTGDSLREDELKLLRATLVIALLAAGAAAAQPLILHLGNVGSELHQGSVTREWIWSTGASTTTFTASGPSEQVNNFDPQGSPLQCPDCELASSTHFVPDGGVEHSRPPE